jgi:hypothetical protein
VEVLLGDGYQGEVEKGLVHLKSDGTWTQKFPTDLQPGDKPEESDPHNGHKKALNASGGVISSELRG